MKRKVTYAGGIKAALNPKGPYFINNLNFKNMKNSTILNTVYSVLFLASFATLIYFFWTIAGGAAGCTF